MDLILLPKERSGHEAELLAALAPPAAVVVARLSREQYASGIVPLISPN